jgi:hypothetical protein
VLFHLITVVNKERINKAVNRDDLLLLRVINDEVDNEHVRWAEISRPCYSHHRPRYVEID